MVRMTLIVIEAHCGGITLYRLNIIPKIDTRSREHIPSLHWTPVTMASCPTRQNVELQLPKNAAESIGGIELDSHKRVYKS